VTGACTERYSAGSFDFRRTSPFEKQKSAASSMKDLGKRILGIIFDNIK
jgi:hypothetical protein